MPDYFKSFVKLNLTLSDYTVHKRYKSVARITVWIGENERLLISIMGPYQLLLKDHGKERENGVS